MYLAIRGIRILGIIVGVLAIALSITAGGASAQVVDHCGQTIDQPGTYVLKTDLDCSGTFANGINIAASDVTFHLGNHTVSSTDCDTTKTIYGIFVPGNISNITLDGGTVRGFVDGVVLTSTHSRVSGMTVTGACWFGIAVQNVGNTVTTSRISHTGIDGIGLQVATNTRIVGNDVSDNAGNGIGLSGGSCTIIEFNILSRNAGRGILISGGNQNVIARNEFDANLNAIDIEDKDNLVVDNTILRSLDVGIYLAGSASPTRVTNNSVLGGVPSDMSDASPRCGLNKWSRNFFDTDLVAGISDGGPGKGCIQ